MPKPTGMTIVDRAAAFLAKNKTVTPSELNDHLNVGNYASKYVLYMRIAGYDVSTVKNGRTVLSYVYNGPGTSGKDPLNMTASTSAVPAAKTAKPKAKPVANKPAVAKAAARVAAKVKTPKPAVSKPDSVEKEFGSTGSVGTIDADWDSIDGLDIKQLV